MKQQFNDVENKAENVDFFQKILVDKFGFVQDPRQSGVTLFADLTVLRRREKKWLYMLSNWSYFMDNKFDIVKKRCQKGIPPSLRGRAWKYLSGATFHMEFSVNKTVFDELMKAPGDHRWIIEIEKDINRQFPQHIMFSGTGPYGHAGRSDLLQLLKAYTILHPDEGYCQAQAPVASVLLMHMPLRDAFYCFVQICHKYLPDYYGAGLESVQIDGEILVQILKEKSRNSYKHLKKHCVEPVLFMIEWFMCLYCRSLPWPTVLRIWDMFFCEGIQKFTKLVFFLAINV
ncbi:unnamed protein product [Dracunculus medinensis]|uniref:Rab-GAP TBC domain-containing protein n=1 Tax=Dracunculus medinensis TaxID=318479 RepID=A0A0N4UMF8_DRAME|nr:unnamed protein product [Dracunculus medinensis]